MTAYETHMPILECVMGFIQPKFVVECGMGLFSTPLMSKAPRCISIETESNDWYSRVVSLIGAHHGWQAIYSKTNSEADLLYLMTHGDRPDLVLVDGDRNRCETAAVACSISDVVVCHDSEAHPYVNNLLIPGYEFIDIRVLTPGTCVFTKNEPLIATLKERFHV